VSWLVDRAGDARNESLMKTYSVKAGEIERRWYVVDAEGKVLGRLATEVARILRGKHKPIYTPHLDTGDFVVVINAEKVELTGRKADQKTYFRHSGFMGGEKHIPFRRMQDKHPDRVIELAVKGMLPKNALGKQMYGKLRVYPGAEHPHQAQQPETLTF
jgi:large subunit ribosomal protein L13